MNLIKVSVTERGMHCKRGGMYNRGKTKVCGGEELVNPRRELVTAKTKPSPSISDTAHVFTKNAPRVCTSVLFISIFYERVLFRCFTTHTVSTGFSFSLVLSQTDKLSKATFSLAGCGGVTRVVSTGDSRQFVLSLSLASSQPLLLATGTEEELTQWQMALCEAVLQVR